MQFPLSHSLSFERFFYNDDEFSSFQLKIKVRENIISRVFLYEYFLGRSVISKLVSRYSINWRTAYKALLSLKTHFSCENSRWILYRYVVQKINWIDLNLDVPINSSYWPHQINPKCAVAIGNKSSVKIGFFHRLDQNARLCIAQPTQLCTQQSQFKQLIRFNSSYAMALCGWVKFVGISNTEVETKCNFTYLFVQCIFHHHHHHRHFADVALKSDTKRIWKTLKFRCNCWFNIWFSLAMHNGGICCNMFV